MDSYRLTQTYTYHHQRFLYEASVDSEKHHIKKNSDCRGMTAPTVFN
jgi:hypothetical protein